MSLPILFFSKLFQYFISVAFHISFRTKLTKCAKNTLRILFRIKLNLQINMKRIDRYVNYMCISIRETQYVFPLIQVSNLFFISICTFLANRFYTCFVRNVPLVFFFGVLLYTGLYLYLSIHTQFVFSKHGKLTEQFQELFSRFLGIFHIGNYDICEEGKFHFKISNLYTL